MESLTAKNKTRKKLLLKRKQLSKTRKEQAKNLLFSTLTNTLQQFDSILSFASFKDEIDLWQINYHLENRKALFLPRVEKKQLEVYEVTNIQTDLQLSCFHILEPNPIKCKKVTPSCIECILVPGIAFDSNLNRLGYGKGFYDRFISTQNALTLAIGFKEQLISKVPTESHDQKVNKLCLF